MWFVNVSEIPREKGGSSSSSESAQHRPNVTTGSERVQNSFGRKTTYRAKLFLCELVP